MRDSHDRFWREAKLIAPVAALLLLASLFLFSKTTAPSDRLDFLSQSSGAREEVRGVSLAGLGDDGSRIELRVVRARPQEAQILLEGVSATVLGDSGENTLLTAPRGTASLSGTRIELRGGVRIVDANGLVMRTQDLDADIDEGWLRAPSTVRGTGPQGRFTAGTMLARRDPITGAQHLVFRDGVDLIYD